MARDQWTPETPWVKSSKKTQAYWPPYVCRNPQCPSRGKSHPNCRCSIPSFAQQSKNLEYDAKGGEVGSYFCSENRTHNPDCEYFADGGTVEFHREFDSNPDLSLDHSIVNHGLLHALTKTGHSKSEDPMRVMNDHLDSVKRGRKELETHSKNIFEIGKEHQIEVNPEHVEALKEHFKNIRENPSELLNVGGTLGEMLPEHAGMLGAKAATAMNYAESIRPKAQQMNPLSEPIPPTKGDEARYNRQLAIMQSPQSAYQALKNGMLQPDDLHTIQAVYPKLFNKMKDQLTGSVIDAKVQGKPISYKHKLGLGSFLGQPMDWSASPAAAQAIIQANGGAQTNQAPQKPQKKSGATAQTQKTIEKTDSMYETPIDSSLLAKKS